MVDGWLGIAVGEDVETWEGGGCGGAGSTSQASEGQGRTGEI